MVVCAVTGLLSFEGEEVDVKVLGVVPGEPDGGRPARVTFSLKQLQADPLLETLDTIMPVAMPEPSIDEDELMVGRSTMRNHSTRSIESIARFAFWFQTLITRQ